MPTIGKLYWATGLALLISIFFPLLVSAQTADVQIPDGFFLVASAPGVNMYRKDYSGGSPDFIQVVDLSQGAKIVTMHGELHERRPGKGAYGGDDARVMAQSLQKFWRQLNESYSDAFCALNGQFFYMPESPTRLPFPLKVGGEIISDGYGINDFPDQKLILEIWPDEVNINKLTEQSLYGSSAPDIIGGLTQTANKRSDRYVGRTFVGVDDRNEDGSPETLLIFNSRLSRQVDAAAVLESFGADSVMMLDGGGSTQLICQIGTLINSDRLIPQAIGVVAASSIDPAPMNPPPGLSPAEGDNFISSAEADPPDIEAIPANEPANSQIIVNQTEENQLGAFVISDVIWVPLIMSPVVAILLIFVNKIRYPIA